MANPECDPQCREQTRDLSYNQDRRCQLERGHKPPHVDGDYWWEVCKVSNSNLPAVKRRAFSVATFILHGVDVLLIKHKRLGLWLPVGGEVEGSETPLEAARRETKEETGLDVRFPVFDNTLDGGPAGFIGYEEHDAGSKGVHMNFNFVAFAESRDVKGDGSFTAHVWHPVADLFVEETTRSVRQCINRIHSFQFQGRIK